jgi:hypothetical protein
VKEGIPDFPGNASKKFATIELNQRTLIVAEGSMVGKSRVD